MARRWLVWVDDKLDGELFKVHSRGKWVWLEPRPHKQLKAGETVHEKAWKARGPKSSAAPAGA
jgi:hypothetical protein